MSSIETKHRTKDERERFERLYRDAELRRVQRAIMERELRKREGTFQPRLASTAPARFMSSGPGSPGRGPGNFEARLHPSDQQLLEKKARAEALKLMQDLEGCTFQVRL